MQPLNRPRRLPATLVLLLLALPVGAAGVTGLPLGGPAPDALPGEVSCPTPGFSAFAACSVMETVRTMPGYNRMIETTYVEDGSAFVVLSSYPAPEQRTQIDSFDAVTGQLLWSYVAHGPGDGDLDGTLGLGAVGSATFDADAERQVVRFEIVDLQTGTITWNWSHESTTSWPDEFFRPRIMGDGSVISRYTEMEWFPYYVYDPDCECMRDYSGPRPVADHVFRLGSGDGIAWDRPALPSSVQKIDADYFAGSGYGAAGIYSLESGLLVRTVSPDASNVDDYIVTTNGLIVFDTFQPAQFPATGLQSCLMAHAPQTGTEKWRWCTPAGDDRRHFAFARQAEQGAVAYRDQVSGEIQWVDATTGAGLANYFPALFPDHILTHGAARTAYLLERSFDAAATWHVTAVDLDIGATRWTVQGASESAVGTDGSKLHLAVGLDGVWLRGSWPHAHHQFGPLQETSLVNIEESLLVAARALLGETVSSRTV